MDIPRGPKDCLSYLQSLAKFSGRAFPKQQTIADKLGVDLRTVSRYIRYLRDSGWLTVKKRQHSSAEYVLRQDIQTRQNVRSGVVSGVVSGRFRPYMSLKTITSEELWPKPMQVATQNRMLPGKEAELAAALKERKLKYGW